MACQVMLRPQIYNDVRTGQQTVICDSCQRILYFNPANEMQVWSLSTNARAAIIPKSTPPGLVLPSGICRGRRVLLCLTNAGGQASRRVFDMGTGRLTAIILSREGDYRHAFPEDITGAIRLNGSWSEAEIEPGAPKCP